MACTLQGALLAAVLLAHPTVALADDMSSREIESELVGRSIAWWEEGGWLSGQMLLLPDGRAEISVDRPRPSGDVGRWSIRGGAICTAWGEVRGGREKCYYVRRGESGRFLTTGGNVFEVREAGV